MWPAPRSPSPSNNPLSGAPTLTTSYLGHRAGGTLSSSPAYLSIPHSSSCISTSSRPSVPKRLSPSLPTFPLPPPLVSHHRVSAKSFSPPLVGMRWLVAARLPVQVRTEEGRRLHLLLAPAQPFNGPSRFHPARQHPHSHSHRLPIKIPLYQHISQTTSQTMFLHRRRSHPSQSTRSRITPRQP